ncbi:hypothetical protein PAMP_021314 [Pampus punctatissimus]
MEEKNASPQMPEQISSECSVHCTTTKRKREEGRGGGEGDEGEMGGLEKERKKSKRTDQQEGDMEIWVQCGKETGSDGKRLKELLGAAKRVNVNIQDADGLSPLHHAALSGNKELISLLLDAQAAVDIKDHKDGFSNGNNH